MSVSVVLSAVTLAPGTITADADPDGGVWVRCIAAGFTLRLGHADAERLRDLLTDLTTSPREDTAP